MAIYFNKKLYKHYGGTGARVDIEKNFVVVLQHPVTTEFDDAYRQMRETLMAIHEYQIPAVVLWPNVDAGADFTAKAIRDFRESYTLSNIHYFRNFVPEDFLALLMKSKCLVGNSSAGIRECSFLGVPVINIGNRQRGRERGMNVIDVTHSKDEIVTAIGKHFKNGSKYPSSTLYGDGAAGEKIADILAEVTPRVEKNFEV